MGTCTKCGRPNEYVDGPYLCYQCKLLTEVFCGEQQPQVSEPKIRHEAPKRQRTVSPWARMSHDERMRAADKYSGDSCLNCGTGWGDHRINDWHCPDGEGSYSETQWFAERSGWKWIPF